MTTFSQFPLLPALQKALAAEGYTTPTPIQNQALPHALEGRDLLGIAQTGTGKTAAFALPVLQRLSQSGTVRKPKSCRALVLSPTRELASQIAESFRAYGRFMSLSTEVVFGGVPIGRQVRVLSQGVDILVATPGRLLDLIGQRSVSLRDIEVLVLDEADQMLDLGFIVPLKRIISMLPSARQSLFFSATMANTVASLADGLLTDPVRVAVTPVATTAEKVTQGVMFVPAAAKPDLLAAVLDDASIERVLVFTRTKHGADRVVRHLERARIEAAAIHGNKSQNQRERALGAFRDGRCRVLVATDIAARGIDVEGVTHVINFELPNVAESYVHRIGRTARAGAAGMAIAFCADDERSYLRDIERLTRQKVAVLELPAGFVARPGRAQGSDSAHQGHHERPRSGGRPSQERPSQDRPSHKRSSHKRSPHERSFQERSSHERPSHERPSHERPSHERSAHERPAHERAFHERPSHERSAHERSAHESGRPQQQKRHRGGPRKPSSGAPRRDGEAGLPRFLTRDAKGRR